MADEIAWVIERAAPGEAATRLTEGPRYLMGFRQGYGAMWTTDHDYAVRFSRKVDGDRIAEHLECPARVVEHKWCELPKQRYEVGSHMRNNVIR